jgi:two-component sensor histidine kinase/HAMP domain-containing protein
VPAPEGPMIVAARSLVSQPGPPASSVRIVVARFLNVGDLDRLAEGIPFTLTPLTSSWKEGAAGEPLCRGLSRWEPVVVRHSDSQFITACALVNGLDGKPALMVRVEAPRETYRRGLATVQYFVLSLLGAGLIFAAVITYVLDKRIVSRLKDLGAAVSAIATGADSELRMPVSGSDELSLLAEQINGMLEALEKSESDLKQARDELEKRVEERTWQLLNTNELLMEEIDQRKLVEEDLRKSEELLKESLTEKEVLLREIHHRVKNNLQVMASLLNLQSDYVRDEADVSIFKDAESRIWSMALVHETLYQSENLALIRVREYVESLVGELLSSYGHLAGGVAVNADVEDVSFGIDTAVPLGLIINELVSNAFKHAFPESMAGEILVRLRSTGGGQFELFVGDSGIGMPKEAAHEREKSFGLHLVNALVRQLGGELCLSRSPGTRFTITFKEPDKRGKR